MPDDETNFFSSHSFDTGWVGGNVFLDNRIRGASLLGYTDTVLER